MNTKPGHISWTDLTVPNAEAVRDFYAAVAGWTPQPVDMGEYADFNMTDADGTPVAGVCHARGPNSDIPPVWMMYVNVDDLDASMAAVTENGGKVRVGPKSMGTWRMAVIEDPAGAILALLESTGE